MNIRSIGLALISRLKSIIAVLERRREALLKYFSHSIQFVTNLFCSLNVRTMNCLSSFLSSSVFLPVREEQRYCLRTENIAGIEKISLKCFFGSCHTIPVSTSAHWRVIVSLKQISHVHFFSPICLFSSLYFIQTCLLPPLIFVLGPSFFVFPLSSCMP